MTRTTKTYIAIAPDGRTVQTNSVREIGAVVFYRASGDKDWTVLAWCRTRELASKRANRERKDLESAGCVAHEFFITGVPYIRGVGSVIKSGAHLGVVRRWIQWNARNGSEVTWGSDETLVLQAVTTRDMENLAQQIADAAVKEYKERLADE